MPKLAVFPKAWLDDLCVTGTMSLATWIAMASTLGVHGLELYSNMLDLRESADWPRWRDVIGEAGLAMPMFCCSPDFTHPDRAFREAEITKERRWIDLTAALGGQYCRVLSGQRRPGLSTEEGIRLATECITACLPHAADHGVTLVLENHYKDNYWTFPEFARDIDVFCDLVDRIDPVRWPNFGVNFDPSNAFTSGGDPLALLQRIKHRVKTMHASDRHLVSGTLEDLLSEEPAAGYGAHLKHGEVGKGLNDYDAIFSVLRTEGFDGWVSVEDGVDGFEQLGRSVDFVRSSIAKHWA